MLLGQRIRNFNIKLWGLNPLLFTPSLCAYVSLFKTHTPPPPNRIEDNHISYFSGEALSQECVLDTTNKWSWFYNSLISERRFDGCCHPCFPQPFSI